MAACLQKKKKKKKKNSRAGTIHPGIFFGRALWADSALRVRALLALHEQFKPIKL